MVDQSHPTFLLSFAAVAAHASDAHPIGAAHAAAAAVTTLGSAAAVHAAVALDGFLCQLKQVGERVVLVALKAPVEDRSDRFAVQIAVQRFEEILNPRGVLAGGRAVGTGLQGGQPCVDERATLQAGRRGMGARRHRGRRCRLECGRRRRLDGALALRFRVRGRHVRVVDDAPTPSPVRHCLGLGVAPGAAAAIRWELLLALVLVMHDSGPPSPFSCRPCRTWRPVRHLSIDLCGVQPTSDECVGGAVVVSWSQPEASAAAAGRLLPR